VKTLLLGSLSYFILVFTAGFVLGVARVLLLVPQIGERYAELLEMPLMLIAIYLAAKFIVYRFPSLPQRSAYLVVGVSALALLLLVEFTVVLGLREISLTTYLTSRDPVSGSAYVASLFVYTLMPFMVAKNLYRAA